MKPVRHTIKKIRGMVKYYKLDDKIEVNPRYSPKAIVNIAPYRPLHLNCRPIAYVVSVQLDEHKPWRSEHVCETVADAAACVNNIIFSPKGVA